ncbi:MAG: hypothetical protein WBX38_04965 [Candidatus Sulfotelmatobacter sp.]|jgi:hypothetical protein
MPKRFIGIASSQRQPCDAVPPQLEMEKAFIRSRGGANIYAKERKRHAAEEKAAILRRHLLDKVPVPDLREELTLQTTVFYHWQKEYFENGTVVFQASEPSRRQG